MEALGILPMLIVVAGVFAVLTPKFLTAANLINVARQASINVVLAAEPPMDPHDPNHMCHGGPFAGVELGTSGLAGMNVVDDTKKS